MVEEFAAVVGGETRPARTLADALTLIDVAHRLRRSTVAVP